MIVDRGYDPSELISINQAVEQKILRIRLPIWRNPKDYLKLTIVDGKLGPWIRLYSPINMMINNRNPVEILWPIAMKEHPKANVAQQYVPYLGDLDPDELSSNP
jgi:hypothetical protein